MRQWESLGQYQIIFPLPDPVRQSAADGFWRNSFLASQGTFPDYSNAPACASQCLQGPCISGLVSRDLRLPEFPAGCRKFEQGAVVAVPEAPVCEYHRSIARKDNIGPPWEIARIQPESETQRVQSLAQGHFWLGVSPSDAGHHPASYLWRDYVGHQAAKSRGTPASFSMSARI